MEHLPVRQAPTRVSHTLLSFRWLQRFWYLLHYGLGVSGVIAGVFATGITGAPTMGHAWMWGVVAAIATAAVTFLGPLQKGESYKIAYFRLLNAVARFESVPSTTVEWLLDEHRMCQAIVINGDSERLRRADSAPGIAA